MIHVSHGLRYLNMDQFHRNIIFLNHLRYFFNKFRIHDRHLREIHGYWHRTMSFPDLFLLITKYFIQNKQVNHMHQIVMFQHRNKHPRSHNAQFIIQLPDQCLRALCAPCVDIHFRLQIYQIPSTLHQIVDLIYHALLHALHHGCAMHQLKLIVAHKNLCLCNLAACLRMRTPAVSHRHAKAKSGKPFLQIFHLLLHFLPFNVDTQNQHLILIIPVNPVIGKHGFQ